MLQTILRIIILYVFMIFIMRVMGKRQIGQLQPVELVVTFMISQITTLPIEDLEVPLYRAIIPVLTLAALEVIISFVSLKFIRLRSVLQGHSIVIIRDGKVDRKQLKRLRYTVDDLLESLRQKDVFDINEVQYAIAETDGSLSVLLKPENRTATVKAVGAKPDNKGFPRVLISDGRMISSQISKSNMDKNEIERILKSKYLKCKDVLLMTADDKKNINIIKKSQ